MSQPVTIDCHYTFPGYACAYLLVENGRAAFIENNTSHAVPRLLDALKSAGLTPDKVDHVIITHVHLDHAGGSSALMNACPNATLLAHPRAAVHVRDPAKLVGSARRVYGDEAFEALYGRVEPVAAERVREMGDGEAITWGGRTLTFLHTRGHANHHFCVQDSGSSSVFTGDAFGLCYPSLQSRGRFIFPSTSPTDFDPVEARRSVERIRDLGVRTAYLTHFGAVTDVRAAADDLLSLIDFSASLLDEAFRSAEPDAALDAFCSRRIGERYEAMFASLGLAFDEHARAMLKMDIDLNGQGVAHAARRRRAGK